MPSPRIVPLSLVALLAALAGTASAAQVKSLPPVEKTVAASGTASKPCAAVTRAGRGAAATTWTAPMSGFVTYRARGRGDWDLHVLDAQRRSFGASQGFGGQEVVQSWVDAGQVVTLIGCRENKRAGRQVALSAELLDIAPPKDAFVKSSLIRVFGTPEQIEALEGSGLDVTHNRTGEYADVMVAGDAQRKLLETTGLKTEVRIDDFDAYVRDTAARDAAAARANARANTPTGRKTYRTYEEIQAELKALVEKNPGRVRRVVIGKSYQGREMSGVEIANNVDGKDGRPVFFFVALHHAREWPSAESAMEFAHLLAAGNGDARLRRILDNTRAVIVPLINPDGYVASRNAAPYDPADNVRDRVFGGEELTVVYPPSTIQSIAPPGGIFTYRRKNCAGAVPSPTFPCELQHGVDPNRNYGQFWGGAGSSPDATSQSFHGPGPWSEPETQAVHGFSQRNNVTTIITMHNVAALVLRPPGVKNGGKAPDETRLKEIGDKMADATGYKSQYGFELYDTTGTTEDWNYFAQGTYGYTVEIGPTDGAFHMPYQVGFINEWDGTGKRKGRGLREALIVAAESASSARDHAVIAGKAPPGRTLRIRKDFETETSEWCARGVSPIVQFVNPPLSTVTESRCVTPKQPKMKVKDFVDQTTTVPANGRFEWHVNPSGRPFVNLNEAYRFTCEDGSNVAFSRDVVVKRGERAELGAICGATPDPAGAPPAAPAPAPVATPPANAPASSKPRAKRLTANQKRVLASCLRKANRDAKRRKWSKKRRAAARVSCQRKAERAPARAKAKSRGKS